MSTANAQVKPTIVFVHGAFAESSSWNGVLTKLITKGYPTVAVANPLRGVKSDADYVASALKDINGPIVAGWAFLRRRGLPMPSMVTGT